MVVYRYKFTPEFMTELETFSKIHKYDERKVYKEAWDDWKTKNKTLIETEIEYMENLGYKGDVELKMYKAGRYYFRKKSDTPKEAKKRDTYIQLGIEIIQTMDRHIIMNRSKDNFTPSNGYMMYLENTKDIINEEYKLLDDTIDNETFYNKIKKMYKNRYFVISKKN